MTHAARLARSLCAAAAALFFACGAPPPDDVQGARAAIQGGAEDLNDDLTFAVDVAHPRARCSGTLIAPNLVLTARHCLSDTKPFDHCSTARFGPVTVAPHDVSVSTSTRIESTHRYYVGKEILVPPGSDEVCGRDVALLVLSTNVPSSEARPAVPLLSRPVHVSQVARHGSAVGFGSTSAVDQGGGVRRFRVGIPITCAGESPDPAFVCPEQVRDTHAFELVTQGGACIGDSGSGLFDDSSIDAWRRHGTPPILLGVHSRLGVTDDHSCVDGRYVRTDAWAKWIIEAARTAAMVGRYPAPDWTYRRADEVGEGAATSTTSGCAAAYRPPVRGAALATFGMALAAGLMGRRWRRSNPEATPRSTT